MPHEGGGLSSAPGDDADIPASIGDEPSFLDSLDDDAGDEPVATTEAASHKITGVEDTTEAVSEETRYPYDQYAERADKQYVEITGFNKNFQPNQISVEPKETTLSDDQISKAFNKIAYNYAKAQEITQLEENPEGEGFAGFDVGEGGLRQDRTPKFKKEASEFLAKQLTPEQLGKVITMVNEMSDHADRNVLSQYLGDLNQLMIDFGNTAGSEEVKRELATLIDDPAKYKAKIVLASK